MFNWLKHDKKLFEKVEAEKNNLFKEKEILKTRNNELEEFIKSIENTTRSTVPVIVFETMNVVSV